MLQLFITKTAEKWLQSCCCAWRFLAFPRKVERFRLGAKCSESPGNWDFISLLFSDTSFSHLNLMDGERNDVITRAVDALTGARVGVS